MVDAGDSKSPGAWLHAGSIPASGTIGMKGLAQFRVSLFLLGKIGNRDQIVTIANSGGFTLEVCGLLLSGRLEVPRADDIVPVED